MVEVKVIKLDPDKMLVCHHKPLNKKSSRQDKEANESICSFVNVLLDEDGKLIVVAECGKVFQVEIASEWRFMTDGDFRDNVKLELETLEKMLEKHDRVIKKVNKLMTEVKKATAAFEESAPMIEVLNNQRILKEKLRILKEGLVGK